MPKLKPSVSVRKLQYQDIANPQLSILNLMVITAICAVTITAITAVGFFGVHALLLVCLVANLLMAAHFTDRPVRFRFWNQFTWCMLMPMVCIFGDPFVFGRFELGKVVFINDYGIACYTFIAWQFLFLVISWGVPSDNVWKNEFVGGTLLAGGIFALAVGLLILPITLLGSFLFGIGVPGFVPWITGWVYFRTARMHLNRASLAFALKNNQKNSRISVVALSLSLAIFVGLLALGVSIVFDIGSNPNDPFIASK